MSRNRIARQVLLDAALDSMKAGSFTMGDVAQRAGVTRQTLYLHFAGVVELAIEAARYVDDKYDIETELVRMRASTTPHKLLNELAKFHGRYNPKIATIVRAAEALDITRSDLHAALDDRRNARRAGANIVAKRLRGWNALAEGWTIGQAASWMLTQGSIPLWHEQVVEEGWATKRYVDTMYRILCAALLKQPLQNPSQKTTER